MSPAVVALLSVLILAVAGALTAVWMRTRREVTTPTERAVHAALHTASLAARPLRRGLDENSAAEAAPHLRELTPAASGLGPGRRVGKPVGVGRAVTKRCPNNSTTPPFVRSKANAGYSSRTRTWCADRAITMCER